MPSLITGGSGLIGTELARVLANAGEEVVLFSRTMKAGGIGSLGKKIKWVQGDLGIAAHVYNAVKENNITDIYHTGAMLTLVSERDPHGSFQTNVVGTVNVLEAARLFGVKKFLFTSSVGTYGLELGETVTDTTIQRPVDFYGIGKLYCEGLGRFYRRKYGLDFRAVRFAAVIAPGVKIPGHWVPPMIEDAVLGKPHNCPVTKDTASWMISLKDAVRAVNLIMQTPAENIKMMNYNVAGSIPAVSAAETASAIQKLIPDAIINFRQDTNDESAHKGHRGKFDDSYARKEWGWKPEHSTVDLIVENFINEIRPGPKKQA
jgi:threonine 3-dehydrogenase